MQAPKYDPTFCHQLDGQTWARPLSPHILGPMGPFPRRFGPVLPARFPDGCSWQEKWFKPKLNYPSPSPSRPPPLILDSGIGRSVVRRTVCLPKCTSILTLDFALQQWLEVTVRHKTDHRWILALPLPAIHTYRKPDMWLNLLSTFACGPDFLDISAAIDAPKGQADWRLVGFFLSFIKKRSFWFHFTVWS